MDKILNGLSGDNTMGFNWSGLLQQISRAKQNEDTRVYSPDELAELNRVIAKTGAYSALSDNVKAQLENTYTPEQKALRAWSNAKQAADRENSFGNLLPGAIGSLFTAGLSDVYQGNAPGAAISKMGPLASMINPVTANHTIFSGGLSDLIQGGDKAGKTDGSWLDKLGAGLDRAVDPNGMVDEHTRYAGDALYSIAPSLSPYMQKIGTALGSVIGSYIPVLGTAAGAAIGSGVGSKLGSGHRKLDYFGDLYDAGQAYVGGSLGGGITGMLGKALVNTGGNLLYPYINPEGKYVKRPEGNQLSLLQDQLLSTGGDLLTGGMGSGVSKAAGLVPSLAATALPLGQNTETDTNPINWASEVQKLTMPVFLKKKKDEKDEGYMDYKFRPKDYLVNYLGG